MKALSTKRKYAVRESLRDSQEAQRTRVSPSIVPAQWKRASIQGSQAGGSRRAITLTEVLISLGILAVGLLGVAALFPVGASYMQKATIADNGSAIAQAVMNDIVTRGTVNPKAWYATVPAAGTKPAQAVINGVDSKFVGPSPIRATYTRPFSDHLQRVLTDPTSTPASVSRLVGHAFIIDPAYVAATVERGVSDTNGVVVAHGFPASSYMAFPRTGSWNYYKATAWDPWRSSTSGIERVWPVRRVTLQDADGWPLRRETAEYITRVSDDLVTDLPSRTDRPARQNYYNFVSNNQFVPLTRQSTGDYSWIASVVPQTTDARNGLGTNPESYAYDVSIVVFHKRLLPRETATQASLSVGGAPQGQREVAQNERAVSAKVFSTGLNGGELLLEAFNTSGQYADAITSDPFQNLKTGHYIALCGPHPNSTTQEPRFFFNWYKVLAIESGNNKFQRFVSVRGPEWPWKPALTTAGANDGELSNDLCAIICRGAIAVHSKTMKLEGPRGGAGMTLK